MRDEALWYKDAVIYEVHVRAFRDSGGDGRGDFRGLIQSLDYLHDLGVTALWLLPFYPSPWRDDGYDISDYREVHPAYGSLQDFQEFLAEAHRRHLRVITELVINHTSDQHPWFQRARRSPPGSPYRDYYVWSDSDRRYADTRIIFKDFEVSNWSWDPVANAYYWHRFYHHQPDLNFDHPEVRREVLDLLDYWLGMGVDGLRLDAVPYLIEREGTNCENLPETHAILRELRRHVDLRFEHRMLLAEANQWPEDAVAYFGQGDECHMAFHFPVMPRLFMAMQMEDRFPILDILDQTPPIPGTCQWGLFLRNHDELTLEMVTDEERDYMYRTYAHDPQARINLGIRRRLAPLLQNDRRRIELMNGLLFSLPGTPILYYGDEIGMGDNIYLGDRNGVRTPMQWSPDRNAGFSPANPQQLYLPVIIDPEYHYETLNVESQHSNRSSLLWWMKRLIALRKRYKAFGRGDIQFLYPDNNKVLAFLRTYDGERILVVANLSRYAQWARIDLSSQAGLVPLELMGQTRFPAIGEDPYFLSLGPHSFFWLSLEPSRDSVRIAQVGPIEARPEIEVVQSWEEVFAGLPREALEDALPSFLAGRRWFGRKGARIKSAALGETVRVSLGERAAWVASVVVESLEGESDSYLVPLGFACGEEADRIARDAPQTVVARVAIRGPGASGLLHDALTDPEFREALLETIGSERRWRGAGGELAGIRTQAFDVASEAVRDSRISQAEQTNTSVTYGESAILKLFRRLEPGIQPDLEVGLFLTRRGFGHVPATEGTIEYRSRSGRFALGLLQSFVPNEGDAWRLTVDWLDLYYERARTLPVEQAVVEEAAESLLARTGIEPPGSVFEILGGYLVHASLLGERTAELHAALASDPEDPDFRPEPFDAMSQRSFYQTVRNQASKTLSALSRRLDVLPAPAAEAARRVLGLRNAIFERTRELLDRKLTGVRIRVHGDFHLGQVLFTGKDFVIIDFEGEPTRSLTERRFKRSPLRDVAGMVRSFHYAAYAAIYRLRERGLVGEAEQEPLLRWGDFFYRWTSSAYLRRYLEVAGPAGFLPSAREEVGAVLDGLLIEKALYEIAYELDHRPDWVEIPLAGVLSLFEKSVPGVVR